jgi:hypothetical protein
MGFEPENLIRTRSADHIRASGHAPRKQAGRMSCTRQAYARETVIAEKFQAMVALGRANSRMKDFYDIWILSRSFSFDGDRLARAIAATFARRGTAIPVDRPDALSAAFAADELKQQQWRAFLGEAAVNPGTLTDVTDDLAAFLMPHAGSAAKLDK